MDKIAQLPESDPKVRAFIRQFCANAAECEFDKQGRSVIPVSYTHLDVYKRQSCASTCSFAS